MTAQHGPGPGGLEGRVFLMLQGPQCRFFARLARALERRGGRIIRVNLCGGDALLWHSRHTRGILTLHYHGRPGQFPAYAQRLMAQHGVTDLLLYGDWRPLHQDAILLARNRGARIWVFEEGYLREGFVTLERDGVNGRSRLPRTPEEVCRRAASLPPFRPSRYATENIRPKVYYAIAHHAGNVLLYPWFCHYRTHRAHNILLELLGILPRYLTRRRRRRRAEAALEEFLSHQRRFFFYPLQLNHDSQIQLYSPYIRQEEAITAVISSFARSAPPDTCLVIKNHPLDNGLTPYAQYIASMSQALQVGERVLFVEAGANARLLERCCGVVLVNSTLGLSALRAGRAVFCLGLSIYAMEGLAHSFMHHYLDDFWVQAAAGCAPDAELLERFCRVLRRQALLEGDYYTRPGTTLVVAQTIRRLLSAAPAAPAAEGGADGGQAAAAAGAGAAEDGGGA